MTARSQATTMPGASRASWPMTPTGRACGAVHRPLPRHRGAVGDRVLPSGRRHDGGPVQRTGGGFADAFLAVAETEGIAMTGWTTPRSRRVSRCSASRRARGPRGTPPAAGSTRAPCAGGGAAGLAAGARVLRDVAVGREGGRSLWPRGMSILAAAMSWRRAAMRAWTRSCRSATVRRLRAHRRLCRTDRGRSRALAGMPSLIFVPEGQDHDMYLLPPIRYPDGRWLVKIGGEAEARASPPRPR
jgi:hypothetical protein